MSRPRLPPALLTLAALSCTVLVAQAAPAGLAGPSRPAACATIPALQGPGNTSPCQGHRDNIPGCITGVTATGFFFQDLAGDGDPATSDGIYASHGASWTNPDGLRPGVMVSVSGTVTESDGTTELPDPRRRHGPEL
jgi:predicted extracellular nuclease